MNSLNKSIMVKYIGVILMAFFIGNSNAQERSLTIFGTAESNMKPLANAKVTLLKRGVEEQTFRTGSDGIFKFSLQMNEEYLVLLEKPGMLTKRIAFNTKLPDDISKKWTIEFAMTLFLGCEGVNTSVLDKPVDIIRFNEKKQDFISDKTYADNIRAGIEKLYVDIENCQTKKSEQLVKQADELLNKKQYEEARSKYEELLNINPDDSYSQEKIEEIESKIGQSKLSEQLYTSAINEADKLFAAKNYELAKTKYQQALTSQPSNAYPREKITAIDNMLNAQNNTEQEKLNKEKQYTDLINKANLAYANKNFEEAKSLYQQALTVKPDATFPNQKISELDPLIAKQKQEAMQNASNDKAFNETMAMAQSSMQKSDFETAKQLYNKALTINPQSQLPKQKINEIDKIVEQQKANETKAQKADNEKKILAALDEGDMYFKQKKYDEAAAAYQRAIQLNPKETYAKQQVEKIASYKQAAEVEKQKTLEKSVNESVLIADNLMTAASYQQAVEAYKQALILKPSDPTLLSKLAIAEQKLTAEKLNKEANAKKDQQYNTTISQADQLYAANKIQEAKVKYQQALLIKPGETYPTSQIAKIDAAVSEQLKKEADNKTKEQQYKTAITQGDQLFIVNKNSEAKVQYQQALLIKPGDIYPTSQIAKIDARIAEQLKKETDAKAKEQQYNTTIFQADQLYAANKNTEAKVQYQQALLIKPGDIYTISQIAKIDARITEQLKKEADAKAKEQQYNSAISQADQLFAANKNTEAKVQYQQALLIKPGEAYPNAQIAKIDAQQLLKEADIKAKEQQYNTAVSQADQLFAANKNTEAKVQYQQALLVKPGEVYPTSQITKIDARIAEQLKKEADSKAKEQQYNTAISQGDKLYTANKNAESKVQYQQALLIKPGETYPTSQITKIDALIAEQLKKEADAKAKEQQYKNTISQADQLFIANKDTEAKIQYQQALLIKPGEGYPTSQIAKIDARIAEQLKKETDAKAKEQQYKTAIAQADQFFGSDKLIEAKAYYEQALKVKPAESYPTEQIKKIEAKMLQLEKEKQAKLEFEQKYTGVIKNADLAYDGKDFTKAKDLYNQALTMRPSETYPRERLNKIVEYEKMVARDQASRKQTSTTTTTTEKPKKKSALAELKFTNDSERDKYLNSLRASYPVGVTLEVHEEEFKSTRRFVVIRDNEVREFRMVKFNWGGVEYSLNGIPITGQYFETQVKVREGEFYQEIKQ
jgi:tetratricopeptide (TPR) repeat protein